MKKEKRWRMWMSAGWKDKCKRGEVEGMDVLKRWRGTEVSRVEK